MLANETGPMQCAFISCNFCKDHTDSTTLCSLANGKYLMRKSNVRFHVHDCTSECAYICQ